MKCTHCNAEIPEDSVFCPSCGQKAETQPQPDKMCQKCQAPLKAEAKFCEFCGATVVDADKTCPACSADVTGGAAFCPNCGFRMGNAQPAGQTNWQAPVQAAVPQQPVYPAQPQAQPYVQPYAQPYGQPATPYPAYGQTPAASRPPKKKKKGLLIAVIIVVVLAIAGGVTALVAGKQIKRLLMGPKATYLAIEGVALKQQTDDLLAELVKYGNTGTRAPKGGMDLEMKVDLEAEKLGIDPVFAAILDNLSIRTTWIYDNSGQDMRNFAAIDLLSQNEKLLTLEAFVETDRMIVGLPEILNQYVVATYDELGEYMDMGGVDIGMDSSFSALMNMTELDLGIDQAAMQKSVYKMIDIVLKHIDSVEHKKSQILKVGTVSAEYDLYTVTLSSENARKMVLELLEHLRTDKEIFNLVNKLSSLGAMVDPYGSADVSMTFTDYQEAIDEAIKDLKDDEDTEPFTLVQKVYVDSADQVFGRDLQFLDEDDKTVWQLKSLHPVKGDTEAWLLYFKDDYDSMQATAQFTVKNDKKTGTASLTMSDEKILDITYTDFYMKTIGSDEFPLGQATISFDAGAGMPEKVTFAGREESGRFWMDLGIPDYGSIGIGYRALSVADAKIPNYDESSLASIADPNALYGLVSETAMVKIMEIMEKLGLSDYLYQ
jgi:hypothetical protein